MNPMENERANHPLPPGKRLAVNKIILGAGALILAFVAGYLPGYLKAQRQNQELLEARQESRMAELRDLASLAYLQTNQRDFGLAAATSTRLFDRIGEFANHTIDPAAKQSLEELLRLRDPITAKLATGEPDVLTELQNLVVKTRQATGASAGAPQS